MANPKPLNLEDPSVQLNTRISIRLREQLDRYLQYMEKPLEERPPATEDWPDTVTAVVNEALGNYLAEHLLHPRKGPRKLVKKDTDG